MNTELLRGSLNPLNLLKLFNYKRNFRKSHPDFFNSEGLLIFSGPQGSGKTLSAVQYVKKLCEMYPKAKLVSNVYINDLPPYTEVIEYDGIDCLTRIENGEKGVIYFIDEIHLEFNSLESKNVPIEVMIEVSQQRKQRKHIVGTSQVFLRLAKPLREQIRNIVLCKKYFGFLQFNQLINGETVREENGKIKFDTVKRTVWFHSPSLYNSYDTFAKMKRYREEWQGVKRENIYSNSEQISLDIYSKRRLK